MYGHTRKGEAMRFIVYDIEVFSCDWLIVFYDVDTGKSTVIHNSNHNTKQFIKNNRDGIFTGFNSKFYDDWILQGVLLGADNTTVKNHSDFIIKGRNAWEFPFVQYQRRDFQSMDLRDDLDKDLSLKAIEGNLNAPIVESSVPFDIDRPLTAAELDEVTDYCNTDVKNTVELLKKRSGYIESKRIVARIKGMNEAEAVSLTNAKLTAKFLDARRRGYDDESIYIPPDELQIGKYAHVLEFFKNPVAVTLAALREELAAAKNASKIKNLNVKIQKLQSEILDRYDCDYETRLAGVPSVFAWGGLHGAIKNYSARADSKCKIVSIDVGSYYPSLMLEYGYMSRSIPSAAGFADVYKTRMKAKRDGDKTTADALKLVLNTCYGAMKNRYNDLYDPRMASAVCITGQLLLCDLVDKLEAAQGMEAIQFNTDGVIIRFPIETEPQIWAIVGEWENRAHMSMEYTAIHAIVQKDVNNYVMKAGESYLVKDGQKIVIDEDSGKVKTKGGYVSIFVGGSFKNNSLAIVNKALVSYFMDGIPVEKTINECGNIFDFQIIAKMGGGYNRAFHEYDGQRIPVQKVNRVYAVSDPAYGTIYKMKPQGNPEKIASLPDHAQIDNNNALTMRQIDKGFYINLSKKRIDDYIKPKSKGSKQIMSTAKKTTTEKTATEKTVTEKTTATEKKTPQAQPEAAETGAGTAAKVETEKQAQAKAAAAKPARELTLYEKILYMRRDFLAADVKKTGINRFAEYKYFELSDIVPVAMPLCMEYQVLTLFDFDEESAYLYVVNVQKPAEILTFKSPMRKLTVKGMNEIQALGGVETYQRRYLYMLLFDIIEQDSFDGTNGKEDEPDGAAAPKKTKKPVAANEREKAKADLIDETGEASPLQINSIKAGLKKLREQDETAEPYIAKIVQRIKAGITKADAESLLIEIGEKVAG